MSADSGKPGRLYQQVAESIAGSITAGQYTIGQRLPAERDLATEFGVSRATVREAIIALEIEGLVDVKVGSGVYVTAVPRTEGVPLPMDVGPFELIEARLLIEGEVAALAARQATAEDLERLESALRAMERGVAEGDATAAEAADHDFHLGHRQCHPQQRHGLGSRVAVGHPPAQPAVRTGLRAQPLTGHAAGGGRAPAHPRWPAQP